jgi:hypothetical protein
VGLSHWTNEMDLIRKEELASQVLAVIGADFHQPSNEDTLDILKRASERIKGEINFRASQESQQQL